MDTTFKIALVAALSAIIGGVITGIVAPYISWGIEKRKQKLAYRKELITKWRKMLAANATTEVGTEDGNLLIMLEHQEDFYSLMSHVDDSATSYKEYKKRHATLDTPIYLHYLAHEISRIEREWDLV